MNLPQITRRNSTALAELRDELSKREMSYLIQHANRDAPELLTAVFLRVVRAIQDNEIEDMDEVWPYAHKVARRLIVKEIPERKWPIAA
jgi:hypothetical protein